MLILTDQNNFHFKHQSPIATPIAINVCSVVEICENLLSPIKPALLRVNCKIAGTFVPLAMRGIGWHMILVKIFLIVYFYYFYRRKN